MMNEPSPLMVVAKANALVTGAIGRSIRDTLPLQMQNRLFMDISARLDKQLEKRTASEDVKRAARLFLEGRNHSARSKPP